MRYAFVVIKQSRRGGNHDNYWKTRLGGYPIINVAHRVDGLTDQLGVQAPLKLTTASKELSLPHGLIVESEQINPKTAFKCMKRTQIDDYKKIEVARDLEEVVNDKRKTKRANKQKAERRNRHYSKNLLKHLSQHFDQDDK